MTPEQIRLLRQRLGLSEEVLPDDATQEQINAALSADAPAGDPPADPPPADPPAEDPPAADPPAADPPPGAATPEAIAAARATLEAAGMVAVPASGTGSWQEVQANAAAGARVAENTERQRRTQIIAAAIGEGRISPAQRQNFVTMFERDPQGAEQLLTASADKGGLMPNTVPVEARGSDPNPDLQTEAYPATWLPELQSGATPDAVTVEA